MIGFVKAASFPDTTTTGTSLACTYAVNPGDFIYVLLSINNSVLTSVTVTDNATPSNTYSQQITPGARNPTHVVFTSFATNTATTITITYPAGFIHLADIATYSGVTSLGTKGSAISSSNQPSISGTLASPVNWAVFALATLNSNLSSWTAATQRLSSQSTAVLRGYIADTTGVTSFTVGATLVTIVNWTMSFIELIPAALTPVLNSMSPNTAAVINPPFTITFHGTNLTGTTAVNVSGPVAGRPIPSNITVINSTTVTCTFTFPTESPTGTFNISLTTPNGTSNLLVFTTTLRPSGQAIFYNRVASQWAFRRRRK